MIAKNSPDLERSSKNFFKDVRRRGEKFTGRGRLSLPKDTFREDAAKAVNILLRIGEETQVGVNRTAGFGMYKIIRFLQPSNG